MSHDPDRRHHEDDGETLGHDLGLSDDLPTLLSRLRALSLFGGVGLAATLAACSSDPTGTTQSGTSSSTGVSDPAGGASISTGEEIPEETAGPFPGDGSNGVNVLTESGIVRSDITTSFAGAAGVAEGVALTVRLTVLDTGKGSWPHIHFEVYPSLDAATSASGKLRTTQLALPEEESRAVYTTSGYEASVANLARTSLETDLVFSDGYSLQLATVTGGVADGLTASLTVPV